MGGQRIGYIRVSSFEQNTERQLEGIALDHVFTDKMPFCIGIRERLIRL